MTSPATSQRQLLDHGLGGVDGETMHLPLPPSTKSSSSSSSSVASALTDDGLVSVDVSVDVDVADDASADFTVCPMKTVSVSSLLMPSPCYVVLLLLCPLVIGFVLFLFVQYFVPVLVQILMDM